MPRNDRPGDLSRDRASSKRNTSLLGIAWGAFFAPAFQFVGMTKAP
jgi:hypothetical protein